MSQYLTEPDEQISADDMETLSLNLLSALPMEGVEGSPLDADVIWKTVERSATDTSSVHHVIENTDETPDDDETVMDWLRTIDSADLEDVVNDLLADMPRRSSTLTGRGSSSSISSITPTTGRISPIQARSVR